MMTTISGKQVDLINPEPENIDIETIIYGLGCLRFRNQTKAPITVLQHSVMVSYLCDPKDALQGLLHDASEAYLGDMNKWLKLQPELFEFVEIDERLQRVIYRKFGCAVEMTPSVKEADRIMVRFEGWHPEYGLNAPMSDHPKYGPLSQQDLLDLPRGHVLFAYSPWKRKMAARKFLDRFEYLRSFQK